MNATFSIFLATAPWLLGAILALIASAYRTHDTSSTLVSIGTAGYLGYLCLSGAMWVIDRAGQPALSPGLVYFFVVTVALAISILIFKVSEKIDIAFKVTAGVAWPLKELAIVVLIVALIVLSGYQHLWLPAQAWDNFNFWSTEAFRYIEHSTTIGISPNAPFYSDFRHPITLPSISAWSAWSTAYANGNTSGFWPWLLVWLSTAFVVAGYALRVSSNLSWACLVTLATLSIPLLENHALLAGYGEIWIATALTSGCVLIAIGLQESRAPIVLAGLLVTFTTILIKGSGVFYASLPILALLCIAISRQGLLIVFLTLAFFSAVLMYIYFEGVKITILGNDFGFDEATKYVLFGGRPLEIGGASIFELLKNQGVSLFLNSSFSVSFSIFAIMIFRFFFGPKNIQLYFFLLTFFLGFVLVTLSQLSDAVLRYAIPGSDTGNTRHMMPLFPLILLALASDKSLFHSSE